MSFHGIFVIKVESFQKNLGTIFNKHVYKSLMFLQICAFFFAFFK